MTINADIKKIMTLFMVNELPYQLHEDENGNANIYYPSFGCFAIYRIYPSMRGNNKIYLESKNKKYMSKYYTPDEFEKYFINKMIRK